jgi:hypothetical protein
LPVRPTVMARAAQLPPVTAAPPGSAGCPSHRYCPPTGLSRTGYVTRLSYADVAQIGRTDDEVTVTSRSTARPAISTPDLTDPEAGGTT